MSEEKIGFTIPHLGRVNRDFPQTSSHPSARTDIVSSQ